jgi:hypothetical protein
VLKKASLLRRIFLLVLLAADGMITGLFTFFQLLGVSNGFTSSDAILFLALCAILFSSSLLALAGVAIGASWARSVAIIAGLAVSLTCLGMVLGIPILIAASRADLSRARRNAPAD